MYFSVLVKFRLWNRANVLILRLDNRTKINNYLIVDCDVSVVVG